MCSENGTFRSHSKYITEDSLNILKSKQSKSEKAETEYCREHSKNRIIKSWSSDVFTDPPQYAKCTGEELQIIAETPVNSNKPNMYF